MRRIVTLTTDFGTQDGYVGRMKGIILGLNPEAVIVDITHDINHFDIFGASLVINSVAADFPEGTVHVVVVDPGVGGARRPIITSIAGHYFVGPDNGIFSLVWNRNPSAQTRLIRNENWTMPDMGFTFHGRDIFAPAAARLSLGWDLENAGPEIHDAIILDWPEPVFRNDLIEGEVIYIDSFGNVMFNFGTELLSKSPRALKIRGLEIRQFGKTFSDVPEGRCIVLGNSFGFIELCLNKGNASAAMGLSLGDSAILLF